ncbi:hypothetical protein [Legionella gresilensis]|uniref:hypothetical protein n=1 Tax=Legionella gresilensis TaxID=91823 RepID=UPI001F5E6B86|nr:hypothetical protein [Legionella gresilensis]
MAKKIKKFKMPNFQQPLTAELLEEVIKARRTQSELRLEDAAALCGVAKETFMKVEHGLIELSINKCITNLFWFRNKYLHKAVSG